MQRSLWNGMYSAVNGKNNDKRRQVRTEGTIHLYTKSMDYAVYDLANALLFSLKLFFSGTLQDHNPEPFLGEFRRQRRNMQTNSTDFEGQDKEDYTDLPTFLISVNSSCS